MAIKVYFNITNVRDFVQLCESDRMYHKAPFLGATTLTPDPLELERMVETYHMVPVCGFAKELEGTGLHRAQHTSVSAEAIAKACTSAHDIRCSYMPAVPVNHDGVRPLSRLQKQGEAGAPLFMSQEVANLKEPGETFPLVWLDGCLDPEDLEHSAFLEIPFGSGPSGFLRFGVVLLTPAVMKMGKFVYQDEATMSAKGSGPFGRPFPFEKEFRESAVPNTNTTSQQVKAQNSVSEPVKYENPVHVGVAMIPVFVKNSISQTRWLCVQRGINPGKGRIAFPGGFQDKGERMVQTVIRELKEELGEQVFELLKVLNAEVDISDEEQWAFVGDRITPSNQCLDFYQYKGHLTLAQAEYICKMFQPNEEVQALYVQEASLPKTPWAFPLHAEMARLRATQIKAS